MKGKGHQIIFVVVLLNFNILGVVSDAEEPNGESQPNYEYIQIFKSIPALFEYLLDALEERPEILEKNDVTTFMRNVDGVETDEYDSGNEKKTDKRDADCNNTKTLNEHDDSNKVDKRDVSRSKDVSRKTVAYEYGNSNIVMKGLDKIETDKVISKRFVENDNYDNAGKTRINRELLKDENNNKGRKNKYVLSKLDDDTNDMFRNYGKMFFGFEHFFGLDLKPEEIEERILTAEKLLEEHNSKKNEQ